MSGLSAAEIDMAGKLSAISFVLEVMLANEMARWPEEDAANFRQDLISLNGQIARGPIDAGVVQAIQSAMAEHLAAFLQNVARREAMIRAQIPQAQ